MWKWKTIETVFDWIVAVIKWIVHACYKGYEAFVYLNSITLETIADAYMSHPILWTATLALSLVAIVAAIILCCKGLKRLLVPLIVIVAAGIIFFGVGCALVYAWDVSIPNN
jgi:hypothetical protein